jgi:hypothetical protein
MSRIRKKTWTVRYVAAKPGGMAAGKPTGVHVFAEESQGGAQGSAC